MLAVKVITTHRQLERSRPVWETLLAEMPRTSYFDSFEWFSEYLDEQGPSVQLQAMLVTMSARPIGLVPLVIRTLPSRLGSVEALTYPMGEALSVGPLGRSISATLMGTLQHLAKAPRCWDLINLRGVDVSGTDRDHTRLAFQRAHLPVTERPWSHDAVFDGNTLSAGQTFLNQRRLRDAERVLSQTGSWEHLAVLPETRHDLKRVQERLRSVQLPGLPKTSSLLPEWTSAAVTGKRLMIQTVIQHGEVVGWLASVAGHKRIDVITLQAPHEAVQEILLGQLLQGDLFDGPAQIFFGEQTSLFASRWGAQERTSWRYTYFSDQQPRAQLLRFAGWLKGAGRTTPAVW